MYGLVNRISGAVHPAIVSDNEELQMQVHKEKLIVPSTYDAFSSAASALR